MRFTELPPAAQARIAKQRESGVAGSLLSAPATAAIRGAGLAAAGEVFGCVAMNVGWTGSMGCGAYRSGFSGNMGGYGGGWISPVLTTEGNGWNAFGPYVQAYEAAWHDAVHRMLLEAAALGAEGVVGVRVTRTHLTGTAWEFAALGTAVRVIDASLVGHDPQRRVWAADLSAEDVAAAIHSGRRPGGIAFGLAVSTKHEDWQLQQQRSSWTGTEVTGLTEMLHASREAARNRITASANRLGGGTLVITAMGTREFDTACGDKESDLHAETVLQGTVLVPAPHAAFRTSDRPGTAQVLSVLPVTDRRRF
ncbi:MAG: heavy metal-binding domain-containing protein [Acidobacteria bacterium]|nr:heavy metal-binding domain-containing protein [Acidobacteriota bacterium]